MPNWTYNRIRVRSDDSEKLKEIKCINTPERIINNKMIKIIDIDSLDKISFKDKDGNYDYAIVRTTALIACYFLIRASDPTS